MPNFYHPDLRKKVITYLEKGGKQVDAARLFSVSLRTVSRWIKQYKATGNVLPKTPERTPYKLDYDAISSYVSSNCDATLEEIATHFSTHKSVISYALKKMGITRKKNNTLRRARRKEA